MNNILIIKNDEIQAFQYTLRGKKINILKYISEVLETTAIINGIIIDKEEILQKLAKIKEKSPYLFKNVRLIVDSNEIAIKIIKAPKLNSHQYQTLVENDFSDKTGSNTDMICGYSILKKDNKSTELLGGATTKVLIERYVNLFNEIGIKLDEINFGIESVIKYIGKIKKESKNTFIININDGPTMLCMIFDEDKFIFSTRLRVMSDTNEEYLEFLSNGLSKLLQFAKSENISTITESYYIGVPKEIIEEFSKHQNTIKIENFQFDLSVVGVPVNKSNIAMALFVMGVKKNEINVLSNCVSYENFSNNKRGKNISAIWLIYPFIFAIIIAAFINLDGKNNLILSKIDEINTYLNDSLTQIKLQESELLTSRLGTLSSKISDTKMVIENINSVAKFTPEYLKYFIEDAYVNVKVNYISYDSKNSIVNLECTSPDQFSTSDYVRKVRESEKFSSVYYFGYETKIDNNCLFNLSVLLPNSKISAEANIEEEQ